MKTILVIIAVLLFVFEAFGFSLHTTIGLGWLGLGFWAISSLVKE